MFLWKLQPSYKFQVLMRLRKSSHRLQILDVHTKECGECSTGCGIPAPTGGARGSVFLSFLWWAIGDAISWKLKRVCDRAKVYAVDLLECLVVVVGVQVGLWRSLS